MNRFVLAIGLLLLTSNAFTQIKKIRAYKQASIPGVRPVVTDEQGNQIRQERKHNYNYWFYIETARSEKIIIADLWIEGERFSVKTEIISASPVKRIINTGSIPPDTVVLVPKTNNKILLTYPSGILKDSLVTSTYLSRLIRANELVIGYFRKGKKYFVAVKTMTVLAPEARQ
jgi:hypothetical protein